MIVIDWQIREKETWEKVRVLNGYRLIGMGAERRSYCPEKIKLIIPLSRNFQF
jgi:hypothetical protein